MTTVTFDPLVGVHHSTPGLPATVYVVDRAERVPEGLKLVWGTATNLLSGGVATVLQDGKLVASYGLGDGPAVAGGWQRATS